MRLLAVPMQDEKKPMKVCSPLGSSPVTANLTEPLGPFVLDVSFSTITLHVILRPINKYKNVA